MIFNELDELEHLRIAKMHMDAREVMKGIDLQCNALPSKAKT